ALPCLNRIPRLDFWFSAVCYCRLSLDKEKARIAPGFLLSDWRSVALFAGDDFFALNAHCHAQRACRATYEEAWTALCKIGVTTTRCRFASAHLAKALFQWACNAICFHH